MTYAVVRIYTQSAFSSLLATGSMYQTTNYPPVICFQLCLSYATGFESEDDGHNSGNCENDIWGDDSGPSIIA